MYPLLQNCFKILIPDISRVVISRLPSIAVVSHKSQSFSITLLLLLMLFKAVAIVAFNVAAVVNVSVVDVDFADVI